MSTNILLIGSGAREHAIARSCSKSSLNYKIFCIGSGYNPGIMGKCEDLVVANFNDPNVVTNYAKEHKINYAIIGPENPLQAGIADALWKINVKVFGPTQSLARIETSKEFARKMLKDFNIPGGPIFKSFISLKGVEEFCNDLQNEFVIKFDGLAGGKGVKVFGEHLHGMGQALDYCKNIIDKGGKFLIEEKFIGEEFSLMSFCDGETIQHMPIVQDHKRAYENDTGPNTGGMGAYSPSRLINEDLEKKIINKIIKPTLKGLEKMGTKYNGFLYTGLMIIKNEPFLIEYNVRMGDPECQTLLPKLKTDFLDILLASCDEKLDTINIEWSNNKSLCIVLCSKGYPDKYEKNLEIENLETISLNKEEYLFHAGTQKKGEKVYATGGRVLNFVVLSNSFKDAREKIIKKINKLGWTKGFYRKDIGFKVIK